MNLETCPKCLGAQDIMVPKKTTGFEYIICDVCGGYGSVPPDIADDFITSEQLFEDEYINDSNY